MPWGGAFVYAKLFRSLIRKRSDETRFLDLDRSTLESFKSKAALDSVVEEIRELATTVSSDRIDVESLIRRIERSQEKPEQRDEPPSSFGEGVVSITRTLEGKARLADEKASVLLDRGVAYSKFGIGFFIFAIAAWQILAWWLGWKTQLIFGIVSSGVLFVFLQFLGSWFLKQYRHFIEVSTYLIEIKSVFDRYSLLYLLAQHDGTGSMADGGPMAALTASLKEEMKWPRARPGFTDDVYYAKDAVSAAELLANTARAQARTGRSSDS